MKTADSISESGKGDSKLVYIVGHLLSAVYHIIVVGAFIWLAYELRNGWVLLGLIFCMRSYRHDFNQVTRTEETK